MPCKELSKWDNAGDVETTLDTALFIVVTDK